MSDHPSEILRRLIAIDHKADSMEDSLAWLVRANAPHLKDDLIAAFGKSERRVQVYLALDGKRNVGEVAAHLHIVPQNVTRALGWLKKKRLVDVTEADGEGVVYSKKFFDAVVGLSESLAEKFGLDRDGRSSA
jgi:DNA-binding transcriptional ArsR family regulator